MVGFSLAVHIGAGSYTDPQERTSDGRTYLERTIAAVLEVVHAHGDA